MNVETLRLLVAKGLSPQDILEVAETLDAPKPRSAAAIRQARYRANHKAEGATCDVTNDVTRDVSGDVSASLPLPPNENKSNPPAPTLPELDSTRARKAGRFPADFACPAWAEPETWADLLKNRKTKHLTNTATAHRKFVTAVEAMADEAWPPGRLLEAIVARGWGGAYDPRENDHANLRSNSGSSNVRPFAKPKDGAIAALDRRLGLDGSPGTNPSYDAGGGEADCLRPATGARRLFS